MVLQNFRRVCRVGWRDGLLAGVNPAERQDFHSRCGLAGDAPYLGSGVLYPGKLFSEGRAALAVDIVACAAPDYSAGANRSYVLFTLPDASPCPDAVVLVWFH